MDPSKKEAAPVKGRPSKTISGVSKGKNTTRVKAPTKLPPADDVMWSRVAPAAAWRNCLQHGYAARPAVRERHYPTSGTHLEALCPECGKHLGYLSQRKPERATSEATMAAEFQFYQRHAKAKGYKPGSAYYRFRHNFGRDPDPAWALPAAMAMEAAQ
jgi:hypothetical protein